MSLQGGPFISPYYFLAFFFAAFLAGFTLTASLKALPALNAGTVAAAILKNVRLHPERISVMGASLQNVRFTVYVLFSVFQRYRRLRHLHGCR